MVFVTSAIALGVSLGTGSLLAGTALGATLAAGGFAAFAAGLGVQLIMGAALRALTPKPSLAGASRGYQVNSRGSALDHQIIYGKVRVGGAVVFDETTGNNNKFLHRIVAVAGHEIESFDRIYINDSYIDVSDLDPDGNVPEVVDSDGSTSTRYNGKLRINLHLGSPDQTADSDLVTESTKWTNEHRLRGIAYMYVRLQFDADVYPNGVPTFTAEVKGKKVYNPATDTTAWSDNPALCLRDYLTSSYGLAEETANIDDTLVNTAVTVCNQTNTDAGTTRYTCNGAFTTDLTPYDVIDNLLTSMGGTLWYAQGKWRMKPAYWTAPVLDLNEDDLRSAIGVSTRHSRRDNFNVVKGTFRGEESNWQTTDYPQVTNADFLTADGGQESVADVDLPFTDNSIEARRLARIALESNRQQLTVNASFGINTMQVQVGDNIRLSNTRFGWTNKEFEVLSWSFGLTDGLDLQVQMILRETAESVFDEVDDGIVYERDNTNLLSPFDVPSVGISLEGVSQSFVEKVSNNLRINVTSSSPERIDYCDVQVRYRASQENIKKELLPEAILAAAVGLEPQATLFEDTEIGGRPLGDIDDSGTVGAADALDYQKYLNGTLDPNTEQDKIDYIEQVLNPYILSNPDTYFEYLTVNLASETEYTDLGQGKLGLFLYKDAPTGVYDVRARAYNTFGIVGEWEYYEDFTLSPNLPTPDDVSGLSVDVSDGDITLSWEPLTSIDLSHYSIRHSPVTSGATWADSTTSVSKIGRPSTSITLPARAGTYLIKAHTKLEKESLNATSVIILPDQIQSFATTLSQTEDSGFTGSKSGTTVVGGSLEIASTTLAYSSGSYVFSSDIDVGADRRVISRIDCTSLRRDLSSGLFDDLSGNFDSLTGLFDDLTGAANFSDTDVEFYIAVKADGAGSFGDYQKFRVGHFYGRYFRFKVVLKSKSSGVTPSISALTAYVEYN